MNMLMAVFNDKRRFMGQDAAQLLQQAQQNQQLLQQATGIPTTPAQQQAALNAQLQQQASQYEQTVAAVTEQGMKNILPIVGALAATGVAVWMLLDSKKGGKR